MVFRAGRIGEVPIRFEIEDDIVVITIDRPQAMNALDTEHNAELERALESRYNDRSIAALCRAGRSRRPGILRGAPI